MSIRTKDEILTAVRGQLGDDTSDEALALIEDITDTIADYENKTNNNGENWEQKYHENDAAWRKKYRDRFYSGTKGEDDDDIVDPEPNKKLTFENLFKEG